MLRSLAEVRPFTPRPVPAVPFARHLHLRVNVNVNVCVFIMIYE
jgi:hypothetical protein